jgi:hypothetical protein
VKDALQNQLASNWPDRAAALSFVHDVVQLWERHLKQRLVGFYLIGSLAHGGYSARYSDIDMMLIAEDPLAADERDLVHSKAAAHSSVLAARLSLFWADSTFSAGRFPPLDRIDYLDHAVVLLERRRIRPARPTLAEVREYLGGEPLRRWSQQAVHFSALEELGVDDYRRYLRTLLYPARFLYSWDTGHVASNDTAVAYLKDTVASSELDLVARALQCRNEDRDPLPLFSERRRLLRLLDICNERLAKLR